MDNTISTQTFLKKGKFCHSWTCPCGETCVHQESGLPQEFGGEIGFLHRCACGRRFFGWFPFSTVKESSNLTEVTGNSTATKKEET